uniref:Rho-GAP domain-containing protein n=1 Tax=Mesocestoides corti TaxID=53468 RepID=A0A5K3EP94_MESCO
MLTRTRRATVVPPSGSSLEVVLGAYADRLAATSIDVSHVDVFSRQRPKQFFDLCKFHLSLLVDLPVEFNYYDPQSLDEVCPSSQTCKRRRPRHWAKFAASMNQTRKPESCGMTSNHKTADVYANVIKLMDHLSSGDYLKTEMIFRKSGNIVRQRELRRRVLSCVNVHFPNCITDSLAYKGAAAPSLVSSWRQKSRLKVCKARVTNETSKTETSDFKAHDYANTLKNVLREMREPILTQDLLPIFISVSKLTSGNMNDRGERVPLRPMDHRVAQAKQLKAIRILRFLLPERNQRLLRRLLDLLTQTLLLNQSNHMSAESLGTIFGPLLLAPACVSPSEIHKQYGVLNNLTTLMIEQGSEGVFAVPLTLSEDIDRNLQADGHFNSRSLSQDSGVDTCSTSPSVQDENEAENADQTVLYTGLMFAQKSTNREQDEGDPSVAAGLSLTECAVAELCATVQALPKSDPRKARLIQRINNSNGGLTPRQQARNKRVREVVSTFSSTPESLCHTPLKRCNPTDTQDLTGDTPVSVAVKRSCLESIDAPEVRSLDQASATTSSSSIGSTLTTPLCCPLIGVLTSSLKSQNQTKPARHRTLPRTASSRKKTNSPIFSEMGTPFSLSICTESECLEQQDVPTETENTSTIAVPRQTTCLLSMRVRRNYNCASIEKPDLPTSDVRTSLKLTNSF